MFGDTFLVAPVMYAGMRERGVYLPHGAQWKNIETGAIFEGGQVIAAQAPLDTMPVFERV
ncbi:hypothetical protein SDC9_208112 [bioreactor metagenome]|uniref:Glycosyl hydrolase family 31 C-terminal domain-containing protein n=1 Tax=bioreactor metagenome TaxID=1076179 RepID=A0A645JJ66_9ZZZZ